MSSKFKILIVLFATIAFEGKCQEPYFIKYAIQDGLNSNIIYKITTDKEGFIWLATDNGVSRFNGKSFINYTKKDGLTDNVALTAYCDRWNRVWFLMNNKTVCYIQNNIIYNASNSSILNKIKNYNIEKDIIFDDEGNVLLFSNKNKIVINQNNCQIYNATMTTNTQTIWSSNHEKVELIAARNFICYMNKQVDTVYKSNLRILKFLEYNNKSIYALSAKGLCKITNGQLLEFDNVLREKITDINGARVFDNNLWVLTINGIYVYAGTNITNGSTHIFKNISANDLYIDKENNKWIATNGNGLLKIPSTRISLIKENLLQSDENIIALYKDKNNTLYTGDWNGILNMYKITHGIYTLNKKISLRYNIRDIVASNDNIIIVTHKNILKIKPYKSNERIEYLNTKINSLKSIATNQNDEILVGGRGFLYIYKQNQLLPILEMPNWDKIYSILPYMHDNLFLGTANALYSVNKEIKNFQCIIPNKINALCKIDNRRSMIATEDNGILLLDSISVKDTIHLANSSTICQSLAFDNTDHTLYIGTNSGLYIYTLKNNRLYYKNEFTHFGGDYNMSIHDIELDAQSVFLATNAGCISIPKNMQMPPPLLYGLYIESIQTNKEKIVRPYHNLKLQKGTNALRINLNAVSFTEYDKIIFKYKLGKSSENWFYSKTGNIDLSNLSYGTNDLYIEAYHENNYKKAKQLKLQFYIIPYWWQRTLSKVLFLLIGLATIFGIIWQRLYKIKKSEEQQKYILEIELKALRSQINPHFIFNSLNSAQEFIFTNKTNEANKFLSMFSKLVRLTLDFTSRQSISLEEEINFLELYLQLEKMRFEDKFNYSIHTEKDMLSDYIYMPSMILQPIVENAIFHGLMNRKEGGNLIIRFEQRSHYLYCNIEDDGIGRKAAEKLKLDQHNSIASKNIESRIELINKTIKHKIKYSTTDKYDAAENATGTFFEIFFPLLSN